MVECVPLPPTTTPTPPPTTISRVYSWAQAHVGLINKRTSAKVRHLRILVDVWMRSKPREEQRYTLDIFCCCLFSGHNCNTRARARAHTRVPDDTLHGTFQNNNNTTLAGRDTERSQQSRFLLFFLFPSPTPTERTHASVRKRSVSATAPCATTRRKHMKVGNLHKWRVSYLAVNKEASAGGPQEREEGWGGARGRLGVGGEGEKNFHSVHLKDAGLFLSFFGGGRSEGATAANCSRGVKIPMSVRRLPRECGAGKVHLQEMRFLFFFLFLMNFRQTPDSRRRGYVPRSPCACTQNGAEKRRLRWIEWRRRKANGGWVAGRDSQSAGASEC